MTGTLRQNISGRKHAAARYHCNQRGEACDTRHAVAEPIDLVPVPTDLELTTLRSVCARRVGGVVLSVAVRHDLGRDSIVENKIFQDAERCGAAKSLGTNEHPVLPQQPATHTTRIQQADGRRRSELIYTRPRGIGRRPNSKTTT